MPDSQRQETRDPLDERVPEQTAELAGANEHHVHNHDRHWTEYGTLVAAHVGR